jgi:glycosyltransferase involved in cell wall biosynthesis
MPTSNRARVLLLIPHLGGGGAERVTEILARFLNRKKYEIHLGLITAPPRTVVDSAIEHIHTLNCSRIRHSALQIMHLIWGLRPAIVLSGMAHLNLLLLLLRPALPRNTRFLVRQNGKLSATFAAGLHPCLSRVAYGLAYRRADLVICQSESMKEEIQRQFHVFEANLVVLPNPVNSRLIRSAVESHARFMHSAPPLIAIGRLVPEKGFDILLEAFASLANGFSRTSLVIAGSGPCESSLKHRSEQLGIADRVHFAGHLDNPASYFRNALLFVLSSRTEGIPNALLEAAAAGLPIVATPASTGLAELLTEKDGVWLAAEISPNALRHALEAALNTIRPGRRYPHSWIEPFELARAIPAYEAAIDRAIEGHAR